ncbi:UNVERIFIED_CONTAM: hypothetical protein GTU68_011585, partial [Idotea baltica]|nr:hypothetical protein [Idotea baltica]
PQIFAYLDDLSATSDLVSQEEIGRTNEGREIRLMKVSSSNGPINKPAIWMDCGIHAREWISPATCLWGLGYLSSQYGVNNNVTTLLDNHDLYILPVLNPDGYNYTMVEDRLWRKNRMQYSSEDCVGTDLNRNYDDGHWGGIGSSNRSCLDIYHGQIRRQKNLMFRFYYLIV